MHKAKKLVWLTMALSFALMHPSAWKVGFAEVGPGPVARGVLVYRQGSHYCYYGFLNTIPTQLPCERRPSKPKPAARTASAVSSARATTEPLVTSTPPRRTIAAKFGATSISTLEKMFAATTS